MPYVKNIIGNHEKLIGIARLHWIYFVEGLFGLACFTLVGVVLDAIVTRIIMSLGTLAPTTGLTLLSIGSWITPLAIISGGFYLLFHVLKILYTEIALTEKRVIHKSGLIFIKIEEIDIEEISAENMDTGFLGSILGYAFVMLDCRFVGDIKLPAIAKANAFVKALHAARTHVEPVYPDDRNNGQAPSSGNNSPEGNENQKPEHEMLKPMEPKPYEPERDENGDIIEKIKDDTTTEDKASNVDEHEKKKEILELEIAKLELEVKLKEAEVEASNVDTEEENHNNVVEERMDTAAKATPSTSPTITGNAVGTTTQNLALTSDSMAASAIQSDVPGIAKMPQITDHIAEELIASGLIPHPDEIKPEEPFIEEPIRPKAPTDAERLEPTNGDPLQHSFGSAAFVFKNTEDNGPQPNPA